MLRYIDSCDHYQSASVPQKWTNNIFGPSVAAGIGSCGSQGLQFGVFAELIKGISFGSTTVGVGHLLRVTLAGANVQIGIVAIGHATARHLVVYRNVDGSLAVYRNDASSGFSTVLLGSTPPDTIRLNETYYLEMKATIADAAGAVDLAVNGANVLSLSGIDTKGSSSAVSSIWFGNQAGNGNSVFVIDDIYAFDDVAGEVTNLLGPVRVEFLATDAPGNYSANFTLVGASTQHDAVRDLTGPDGDTSYIQSATVGHKYSGNLQGTGVSVGSIYGVQTLLNARVTDAGFRGIKPLLRQGGVDYLGTEQYPGSTYRYLHEVFEKDPNTAAVWTIAGVNALELGVEIT